MTLDTCIRVALTLMLGAAAASAQAPIETRGAWRLVPDGEDFALRTQARDAPDATLSLFCRKAQERYALEIRSPALAARPEGEEIRLAFKVDGDDQVWLTLPAGPDGTIPIAHQTAFWIIYPALIRDGASVAAFSAADQTWQFSLDGLGQLGASLNQRCGFEPMRPEPPRRRQGGAPRGPSR